MKKSKKIVLILITIVALFSLFSVSAFAITESEVQQQVNEKGKEAVTGNVFIWFLCAIAFLKVSQKIDSFMSSLGINVGHTGGSMLGEAMIAARGLSKMKSGFSGGGFSNKSGSSNIAGAATRFSSGGLTGMVGRQFTRGAANSVTGQGNNPVSKTMFNSSLKKGGDFANGVISSVARGNIAQSGSITGTTASQALSSYMGFTGENDAPHYDGVEIGGGRITGIETSAENPNGKEFAMYDASQYMPPDGEHFKTDTADGAKWYLQYAQDTVQKTPVMKENGKIAYKEEIVQKLPPVPRRKDKI